jgi:hypothetical protein
LFPPWFDRIRPVHWNATAVPERAAALDDPFAQIDKKLDEVVGKRFDERGARERIVKWVVAAACVIVWVIESHRLPPENARPMAKKPVIIQILPAPAKP